MYKVYLFDLLSTDQIRLTHADIKKMDEVNVDSKLENFKKTKQIHNDDYYKENQ